MQYLSLRNIKKFYILKSGKTDGKEVSIKNRTIKEGNHMELKVGDKAPDFKLSSTRKEKISLSDYEGKKNVLLAFYPLNFTPG